MSTVGLTIALVLAIANVVFGQGSERAQRLINGAAWLGVIAGFLALQFAEGSLALATATVSLAGLATVRCITEDPDRRRRILGFGSAIPAMIAVVGLICVRDAGGPWSGQMVLYSAAFAAAAAGASSLLASAAVARAPVGSAAALASLGALGGIALVGTGRSSLSEAFYGFPLRAGDEPLQWVMGPVPGFEDGIRLAVAVPVPWLLGAIGVLAAAALSAGVLAFWAQSSGTATTSRRLQMAGWGISALGSLGILATLQNTASGLSMPEPDAYAAQVKRMLLARDVADRVPTTGEFTVGADGANLSVSLSDLAPEIFGFGLVAIIGALAVFALLRHRDDESDTAIDLGFARDHALRGIAFLWISWGVLLVVHNVFLGAPGMGAPGEWVYLGVLLAGTGLVLFGWRMESIVERRVMALAAGLTVAGLLLVAGAAWRFGALPGLSIGAL